MSQTFSFELDMDKSRRSPQMVAARVGDMGSIHINANLVLNGAAYTPAGQNAYFECITNADTSVRVQAQKSGSTVSVDIPSQALCKPGVITCAYFRFENGTTENPTFVESTQSFGIIVPTSIDDNIDAEDYLGDWRALEQQLQGYVDEVSAAATQAKKDISSDTSAVESAKSSAISSINADKQEVADAAADVMKPINDVLDQFNEDSQDAINSFNSKGTSAISAFNSSSANAVSQFNTNGTNAVNSFNTKGNQAVSTFNANGTQKIQEFDDAADTKLASVDKMISQAQSDVDADIAALQKATQDAIDAMEAALSEDQYGEILQRLNRVWKLSHQDMTAITNGQDLNSFKSVGCYVCQTNAAAQTLQNKPEDLSVAFFLYILSISSTGSSQYYTQLIIPYKPAAGKMKFFTRSFDLNQNTWDEWAEVGSGADITAGEGIIVTGDDTKQVALDPDAFHESIEGAELASFDTSVTGGGSVQEMVVYGNTVQNLWVNPSGTQNGVTATANADGSIKVSGTATYNAIIQVTSYALKPAGEYTLSIDKSVSSAAFCGASVEWYKDDTPVSNVVVGYNSILSKTFTIPSGTEYCKLRFRVVSGVTVSGTYRVMLNEGSTAEPWCPPGLNSVGDGGSVKVVTAGKNIVDVGDLDISSPGYVAENQNLGHFCQPGKYIASFDFSGIAEQSAEISLRHICSNGTFTVLSRLVKNVSNGRNEFSLPEVDSTWNAIDFFTNSIGTYSNFQLELGSTATAYEPPIITTTPIDLQGHTLNALPDGTRDELHIDGGGNVVLEKRVHREHIDASSLQANNPEFCEVEITEKYRDGVMFTALSQQNDFAPVNNADDTFGYPVAAVYTMTSRSAFRVGDGTTQASSNEQLTSTRQKIGTKGVDVMWALAEPQTIDLGKISLPSVSSGQLNVWVDGSSDGTNFTLPVTIDVVANKVDYRLTQPVDLSSKEDAFDVLPVSKGGTGTTSAQAERNRLGLGNTTGALPIANGGTGSTSAANARSALGITPANIGAAPASHTHNYAGSTSAGGAATSANKVNATSLANVDLNDYRTEGTFYYGSGSNGCTNKPSGVDAFGMVVMRTAGGYYAQLLHGIDDDAWFFRQYGSGAWTTWNRLYSTNSKPTPSEIGAAASSHSHAASDVISGTLPVARGGTGNSSAYAAFTGLANSLSNASSGNFDGIIAHNAGGGYSKYTPQAIMNVLQQYINASNIASGTLPIANGGTGATSASNAANAILGSITGSTNTLGSTAEFFIDDGGVPSRLGYLTLVSDISARLLGNSESNAKVKFLTVENVGGTLAGVASNIYDFIYDCDNDGNEFLCLAKFTATIAGQSFNVGLVGRLEKDLSNGGPSIYMSGIGWPTSVDSTSDNDAGLLLVHAFTNVTSSTMNFTTSSLYFLGIKSATNSASWPPSSYNVYGARYNSGSFSFNRMLLLGYDSKMVV